MKSLHFILTGLSLSTLAFVLPACSDDTKSSTGNPQSGSGGSDAGAATGGSENGGSGSGGKGGSANGGGGGTGTGGASGGTGTGGTGTGGAGTGGSENYPDGSAPSPACEKYCTDSLALCTGANAQFANEDECQAACKDYASGSATGNTIECRQAHLDFITGGQPAATHCVHTGKNPETYCQP